MSNLKVSDDLQEGVSALQENLAQARSSKDFVAVAKKVASLVLKNSANHGGVSSGEEFAVIFTGSDLNDAMKRLNQFRKIVEACKFGVKGKRIVITMSVGCALFQGKDEPDDVYERADKALLKAKQTGRNKCLSEKDL
ncbi:MAG: diguanylate cyclase [Cycloclasticus sp.]